MATSPNAMMGQVAPGTPSNLSPSVIAQLQQDMMGMPLDQLQQYAQKHMDDPVYGSTIVSMASYVANMKKAAQVPTTSPNQPTVAQQAVQSIAPPPPPMQAPSQSVPLPESQGIGQLPAKNLEGMADGGIAGPIRMGVGGVLEGLATANNISRLSDVPYIFDAVNSAKTGNYGDLIGSAVNAALPIGPALATYSADLNKNEDSDLNKHQYVQGHFGRTQRTWANGLAQGGRIHPGTISPEQQRASVYGASQIGHAAGGIVGYAGGGHVPSYAGITDGSLVTGTSTGDINSRFSNLASQVNQAQNQLAGAYASGDPQSISLYQSRLADLKSQLNNRAGNQADLLLRQNPQPMGAAIPTTAPATAAAMAAPPGEASYASPTTPAPAPAAAPATSGATGNITSGNSAMSQGLGSFVSPTGKMIADAKKALGDDANMTLKDHVAQAQGMLPQVYSSDDADLEIQAQKFRDAVGGDPAFKKDLDRLDKLDSKLEKNKQDSVGINTLLAGLSMIRSGNPWEAIAQGAGTGLKSYKDDMDKIDKAQEEHEKMRQNLDVAAMANNMGFTRMAADSVKEAKSAQVRSAEAALSAGSHAFDAEQQRMTTLAGENIRGQYGLQQATIGANAPSATMKDLKYFMDNPAALEMQKNMPAFQQAARQEIQTNLSNSLKIAQDMSGQFTPEQKNQAAINVFAYQKQLDEMAKNATPKPVPTANDYAYVKANPSAREKFVRTFGIEP